jgi:uncharacterized phiE125 gp8 family phage protein
MALVEIEAPTEEPVDLALLFQNIRCGDVEELEIIKTFLSRAREYAETRTRRSLAKRTLELRLTGFPIGGIDLPMPPLLELVSIKYEDATGVERELVDGSPAVPAVEILAGARAVLIPRHGESWPNARNYGHSVKVRYKAGFDVLPQEYAGAIIGLATHWWLHRSAVVTGVTSSEVPFYVDALLGPSV